MPKRFKIIIILTCIIIAGLLAYLLLSRPTNTVDIRMGSREFSLLVADNHLSRTRGLSGMSLESLANRADGMLFLFSDYDERTFWMKNMQFPLDIIWLRDGKVMKIERDIAPLDENDNINFMHSSPFLVNQVIELPAGRANELGIFTGIEIALPSK